jgi:hypothetical protein
VAAANPAAAQGPHHVAPVHADGEKVVVQSFHHIHGLGVLASWKHRTSSGLAYHRLEERSRHGVGHHVGVGPAEKLRKSRQNSLAYHHQASPLVPEDPLIAIAPQRKRKPLPDRLRHLRYVKMIRLNPQVAVVVKGAPPLPEVLKVLHLQKRPLSRLGRHPVFYRIRRGVQYNKSALLADELPPLGVLQGTAAQGYYASLQVRYLSKRLGLQPAEAFLPLRGEYLRHGGSGPQLYGLVQVDEGEPHRLGKSLPHRGLSGSHEPSEKNQLSSTHDDPSLSPDGVPRPYAPGPP